MGKQCILKKSPTPSPTQVMSPGWWPMDIHWSFMDDWFKTNFQPKLGFCPNRLDPIPLLVGNTEPEGGRGDSGYYLLGIWVAHRVSLAHRGGRDAHRVKGDEHPPLPYEHPPLHWKCVGGRGGSLPPLWASIFVHWSLFQPIEIAIIIPTLSLLYQFFGKHH